MKKLSSAYINVFLPPIIILMMSWHSNFFGVATIIGCFLTLAVGNAFMGESERASWSYYNIVEKITYATIAVSITTFFGLVFVVIISTIGGFLHVL